MHSVDVRVGFVPFFVSHKAHYQLSMLYSGCVSLLIMHAPNILPSNAACAVDCTKYLIFFLFLVPRTPAHHAAQDYSELVLGA